MTGVICQVAVLMCSIYVSAIVANITGCITIRREIVGYLIEFFAAFATDFPMTHLIGYPFTAALVASLRQIAASFTGVIAAVREGVLQMADTTAAVRAACPVIEIVMIPVATQIMLGDSLHIAFLADLLMVVFVDVGIIRIGVYTCCGNLFFAFCSAILTGDLLAACFTAGGIFQHFAQIPLVITGFIQITLAADA